ncbi:hypothetical protein CXE76_09435 [Campylobacter coli]|uniref:hypothetical protein n=1 Tax=Campylobacter coli TaxID=195 RepID=UPI0003D29658|nr:hypothetical protein [Campylobacter coli]EAH5338736.1 hypothetical protein [Campylobacter jejuni]EAH5232060.1 hypothetical protein [Campylobacter coli]EAH5244350.1 hypothetical protein [Campylobacter coli]EAH5247969.1 hypothetical protein [Campylobacter coli]EAH5261915.1 hypothetical protein [Campylobacter coli]
MTKTQAFVDGFVGRPIKNECFNLWDLNAIIREKQAKLYKENIEIRENKLKKLQKQKMSNSAKKEDKNTEIP